MKEKKEMMSKMKHQAEMKALIELEPALIEAYKQKQDQQIKKISRSS